MKRFLVFILMLSLCTGIFIGAMPSDYSVLSGESVKSGLPFTTIDIGGVETASLQDNALPAGKYTARIKLFGFLPIKTARLTVIENKKLVPLGVPFGVKLYTDGVIVVDITDFVSGGKVRNPAYESGIREGDIIISYNGVKIKSNEQLIEQVGLSGGRAQKVSVRRNNLEFDTTVTPLPDDNGGYRIGLWVRDSTAGIGMLTYYDKEENVLTGLGHSVSDSDTGLTMPVSSGELVLADIKGVTRGKKGAAGELAGSFVEGETIGVLTSNKGSGISAVCVSERFCDMKEYGISLKDGIKTGKATVLCCVDGMTPKEYDIKIEKIMNL